ncbi:hypothetical protein SODALDRAFT_363846 [Sodiomyces alkalinus F11]|uniref:Uncharacterized protein n=1 Tax=Sodiomyces alkalinus (strain CBS 110278 / VKM F-3762 / F11) TaxID=1314773 RepID=A0A3N2PKV6_SODAK|nr:hypothetical protein SODALDRAFT_363846 [Sodiomyces alkalinus F11]ROT35163.1 hypothetical protein SODALDRAFT_363846 [Sodiomyces alkalinus F11]
MAERKGAWKWREDSVWIVRTLRFSWAEADVGDAAEDVGSLGLGAWGLSHVSARSLVTVHLGDAKPRVPPQSAVWLGCVYVKLSRGRSVAPSQVFYPPHTRDSDDNNEKPTRSITITISTTTFNSHRTNEQTNPITRTSTRSTRDALNPQPSTLSLLPLLFQFLGCVPNRRYSMDCR